MSFDGALTHVPALVDLGSTVINMPLGHNMHGTTCVIRSGILFVTMGTVPTVSYIYKIAGEFAFVLDLMYPFRRENMCVLAKGVEQ